MSRPLSTFLRSDLGKLEAALDILEEQVKQFRRLLGDTGALVGDLETLEDTVATAVPVIETVAADLVAPCLDRMPGGGLAAVQCQFLRDHEGRHVHLHLNNAGMETRTEWHGPFLQVTRTEVK